MTMFYNPSGLPDDAVQLTFEHFDGQGAGAVFRVYINGDEGEGVFFEADGDSQFDIILSGLQAWDSVHRDRTL